MSTQNANKILQLRNCVTLLQWIAGSAKDLAADQTEMPDGSGTVAGVFQKQIALLEVPYLQLLDPVQAALSAPAPAATPAPAPATIAASIAPPAHNPLPRKMAGSW